MLGPSWVIATSGVSLPTSLVLLDGVGGCCINVDGLVYPSVRSLFGVAQRFAPGVRSGNASGNGTAPPFGVWGSCLGALRVIVCMRKT